MGVPQLRIKKVNNYGHGSSFKNCGMCVNFTEIQITGIGGKDLGEQPRCKFFGLGAGRMYRINPEYICDAYEFSKKIES